MNLSNGRTTVFGGLALVAAFITQNPELLSAVFDPVMAKDISTVAAACSLPEEGGVEEASQEFSA